MYSHWLYAALSLVLIYVLRRSRRSPCPPFPLLSPFRAGRGRLPHSSAIADGTSVFLPRHDKIRPRPDLMCIFTVGVSVRMYVCVSERELDYEQENTPNPWSLVAMEFLLRDDLSLLGKHTHSFSSCRPHLTQTFPVLKRTLPLSTGAALWGFERLFRSFQLCVLSTAKSLQSRQVHTSEIFST